MNTKTESKINNLLFKKIERFEIDTIYKIENKLKSNYELINRKQFNFFLNKLVYLKKKNKYVFDAQYYIENIETLNKDIFEDNINHYQKDMDNIDFLKQKDKTLAYQQFSKVRYIEHINEDKEYKIFITLTCNGEYHPTSSKYKFNTIGESIELSLKFQKKILREYYKEVKKTLKRKEINTNFDYIRIMEQHKSKVFHSHSLYYCDKEQYEIFNNVYKRINKKYGLKQTRIVIVEGSKTSTYIAKYLIKTIKNESQDNTYNEVKRYYSSNRLFVSSHYKHTTQNIINKVYNHLKKDRRNLFKKLYDSDIPIYYNIEKYIEKYLEIDYKDSHTDTSDYSKTIEYIDNYLINNNNVITPNEVKYISLMIEDNIINKKHNKVKKVFEIRYKKKYRKKLNVNKIIYNKNDYEIEKTAQNIFTLKNRGNKND